MHDITEVPKGKNVIKVMYLIELFMGVKYEAKSILHITFIVQNPSGVATGNDTENCTSNIHTKHTSHMYNLVVFDLLKQYMTCAPKYSIESTESILLFHSDHCGHLL